MSERCNKPATWQTENSMRLCSDHQRLPDYADIEVYACNEARPCDHPLDGMGAASSYKRGMASKPKSSVELYSGIRVDSPETLAEVLRLLDSLDDMKPRPRMLPGVSRFRVREEPKRVIEPRQGRRMIG